MSGTTLPMADLPVHTIKGRNGIVRMRYQIAEEAADNLPPRTWRFHITVEADGPLAIEGYLANCESREYFENFSLPLTPQVKADFRLPDDYLPFRFLDLPGELREMVYDLVLPKGEERHIIDWRRRFRWSLGQGFLDDGYTESLPKLFLANKQIMAEARSFVFRHNVIRLHHGYLASPWLKVIGIDEVRNIRNICIGGDWSTSSATPMIKALIPAARNNLQSVSISLRSPRKNQSKTPADFVSILIPLFTALYEKHQSIDKVFDIFSVNETVLSWFPGAPPYDRKDREGWGQRAEANKAGFVEELKKLVRARLEG